MHITSLQTQATNPDRINIFADGQFLMGINALLVLQMGLQVGQVLSAEQLEQLRSEEALQQAVDRALNFLALRPRSRQEVRYYLRRKNTPPELIEKALTRLDKLNLINDHDFATFWVETREQFKPKGARALKNELRLKGVQREIVDELVNDEQDEERAKRAAHKKALLLAQQADIDYATFSRRLSSFLQRRGFNYDVVSRTIKQLWEEIKGEANEEEGWEA
jgi:regulatory protein